MSAHNIRMMFALVPQQRITETVKLTATNKATTEDWVAARDNNKNKYGGRR